MKVACDFQSVEPAVDHQTPPDVSLENYRHYIKASELFFDEMTYKYIGRHQK
jgi:hypothetical protein